MHYGSDFSTVLGQEYGREARNAIVNAAAGWANQQIGSKNRLVQQFGVSAGMMAFSSAEALWDSFADSDGPDTRASREQSQSNQANQNDQNRRAASLFQGWQFWKDEEENAGLDGGASAGQLAGRSLDVAKLIRNGQLDPRRLAVDADGNFILPDGTVLTRGDLNAILYGGTQDAHLRFSDGSQEAENRLARGSAPDKNNRSRVDEHLQELKKGVLQENSWAGLFRSLTDDPSDGITLGETMAEKIRGHMRASLGKAQHVLKAVGTGLLIEQSRGYARLKYSSKGQMQRLFLLDIRQIELLKTEKGIKLVEAELTAVRRRLQRERAASNGPAIEVLERQRVDLIGLKNRLQSSGWLLHQMTSDSTTVADLRDYLGLYLQERYSTHVNGSDSILKERSVEMVSSYLLEHEAAKQLDGEIYEF